MPLKFGVVIPHGFYGEFRGFDGNSSFTLIYDLVNQIEKLGFHSVWMHDHFQPLPSAANPEMCPVYECWTTLSALASMTKRIRLGQLVSCNSYRNPALLAKISSCFDVISRGRLDFGIGAGWLQKEYEAYGVAFPEASQRIAQLSEALTIIKEMWTKGTVDFAGKYYSLKKAACNPKPTQKPHPPILIGGAGEKLMLDVVARYANRCNFMVGSPEEYSHKLDVLKKKCSYIGRDFNEIEKTWFSRLALCENEAEASQLTEKLWPNFQAAYRTIDEFRQMARQKLVFTPEQMMTTLEEYSKLGVTYFILDFMFPLTYKSLQVFTQQVMPEFSETKQ